MSLRKKACRACVSAKRKCDSAFPICQRCSRLVLTCVYPYMPPQPIGNPSASPRHKNGEFRGLQFRNEPLIRRQYVDENLTNNSGNREEVFVETPVNFVSNFSFNEIEATPLFGTSTQAGDVSPITNGTGLEYRHDPSTYDCSISFDRRILEFWPRVHDTETWKFCITSLLLSS